MRAQAVRASRIEFPHPVGRIGRKLSLGRRSEFSHGDDEADLSASLRLLEREMMEQSQFLGDILLSKFPIAHKTLRPKIAVQLMNRIWDRRILGCARDQVNAGERKRCCWLPRMESD